MTTARTSLVCWSWLMWWRSNTSEFIESNLLVNSCELISRYACCRYRSLLMRLESTLKAIRTVYIDCSISAQLDDSGERLWPYKLAIGRP